MTFERKLLVGFHEIEALVFQCNQCQSRTAIPIQKLESIPACPNHHNWNVDIESFVGQKSFFELLISLVRKFGNPDDHLNKQSGFTILLEFEGSEELNDIHR